MDRCRNAGSNVTAGFVFYEASAASAVVVLFYKASAVVVLFYEASAVAVLFYEASAIAVLYEASAVAVL